MTFGGNFLGGSIGINCRIGEENLEILFGYVFCSFKIHAQYDSRLFDQDYFQKRIFPECNTHVQSVSELLLQPMLGNWLFSQNPWELE